MRRQQLLEARKSKGFSISEMAKKINISTRYYCYIESGERTGSLSVLQKIAKVLEINDINLF